MEKYFRIVNSLALVLIAAGLFTLSYVTYLQEDRGRWLSVGHQLGSTVIVDSYTGRVWHMEYNGRDVEEVFVIDVPDRKVKIFKGNQK